MIGWGPRVHRVNEIDRERVTVTLECDCHPTKHRIDFEARVPPRHLPAEVYRRIGASYYLENVRIMADAGCEDAIRYLERRAASDGR